MRVAPLEENHLDAVTAIEQEAGDVHWARSQFEAELKQEFIRFFVALDDNKILGFGGYRRADTEAQITNLVIRKASQCQGVGRRLLGFVLDCARGESCTTCTLEVRESNAHAQSLYKKLGFEVQGKRDKVYENPDEAAVLMGKAL